MKNIYSEISTLLAIFLLAFLITGCGKKDSASDSGATDSKKESTKQESASEESKNEPKTSGSGNTDAMIDEYQEIIDEYIAIIKEVKGGNMSEMKKMQELSVKASTWAGKLAERAPELTEAQRERIKKIGEEAGAMMK